MREISERIPRETGQQLRLTLCGFDVVPPDMRNLDFLAWKPETSAAHQAESLDARRLIAILEEPLQSKTDPQQRHATRDGGSNLLAELRRKGGRLLEMSDTGHDDGFRAGQLECIAANLRIGANAHERFDDRRDVAGVVVEYGDVHG